jgi:hypothetical protein
MIINVQTGEVLDWSQATEEEILDDLRELEEVYQLAKQARDAARSAILDRMTRAGATLLLTDVAKVRINYTSKVRDPKLVELLYKECPEQFREKCFQVELKPRKAGLNELAKLGADWKKKVESIYVPVPSLKVEWQMSQPELKNGDTPF